MMRYDSLLEAVSESEPCGPDLDEVGDEAYLNYVLSAPERLPERFYDRESGAPFDRGTVDVKSEVKTISELLERSRDLRLLALEARFQCLGGQIVGFCECLQAMAALVEQRWEDVHPKPHDGDYTFRQNTLSALDDRTSIILPLEYTPLAHDKRIGQVCLRDYRVATGQAEARDAGRVIDLGDMLEAMGLAGNRDGIDASHEAVCAAERALSSIRAKFMDAAPYEYLPDFSGVAEVLGQLRAFIETGVPSLAPASPDAAGDATAASEGGDAAPAGDVPAADGVAIGDHAAAAAALLAVEHYFASTEPSSPALILVHQARMLVGQPLVVALETLLPESAEHALISFDPGRKLQLGMARMKLITDAARNGSADTDSNAAPQQFAASGRQEAERLIQGVEAFFRRSEPSSPIPMLLAKGKSFMNRDFSAILSDLINNDGRGGSN